MSLFGKLFGRKGDQEPDPMAQEFDAEWLRAVQRFQATTGMGDLGIKLVHPKTHEAMSPHQGIAGTFSEWKAADAPYNQRRILSNLLFDMVGGAMKVWHAANFYTADSRPADALEFLEEEPPPDPKSDDYAPHCAAFAKTLLSMTRYPEALEWARKAADAAPDNPRFQVILADALQLNDECEDAHAIYSRLMATGAGSDASGMEAIETLFRNLFAADTGVASSPLLALELATSFADPAQATHFWELAETEFYYSPHFRMQHAYHLAKVGATERSFAKLAGLVQEMPWVKEANLNLELYFRQFDPTGKAIMPEFQEEVRRRIRENGWTVEGMHEIEIAKESADR